MYKSKGVVEDRIFSQAEWILENVSVNKDCWDFIDMLSSYDEDDRKNSIAADILADAAKFMRKQFFNNPEPEINRHANV